MKIRCINCNKLVSTEIPENTIFRATATCPECENAGIEASGVLAVIKRAYRKHCHDAVDIGWAELGADLRNEICNIIGSDEFCDWVESLSDDGTEPQ